MAATVPNLNTSLNASQAKVGSVDTNGDTEDLTTPQKQSNASETAHFEDRNSVSFFGNTNRGRASYAVAGLSIKRAVTHHPLYVGAVLILSVDGGLQNWWHGLANTKLHGWNRVDLLGWEREKQAAQKDQRED